MDVQRYLPYTHCHCCGHAYEQSQKPHTEIEIHCRHCNQITYKNPIPVAVLLIPTPTRRGLFLVQRGIEPKRGAFACPGGFMMEGESWKVAAAREALEEIHISIEDPEDTITLLDVVGAPPFKRTLIFGLVRRRSAIRIDPFKESDEALDRVIVEHESRLPIAFPLHETMIKRYLNGEFFHHLEPPNR